MCVLIDGVYYFTRDSKNDVCSNQGCSLIEDIWLANQLTSQRV